MAAVVFLAAVGLLAVFTFNAPLAMLGWPGIIIMNKVYSSIGIYFDNSTNLVPLLVPGLVIDIALYTALFFAIVMLWRTINPKSDATHPPS